MGTFTPPQADLGYLLHRAAKHFRTRMAVELSELGITPAQAAVLMALGRTGVPMSHKAVAQSIDADPATTSGLLARLERDGWLWSQSNPADGRSRIFGLTEQGVAIVPRVFGVAADSSRSASEVLTAQERDTLAMLLAKLVVAAEGEGE